MSRTKEEQSKLSKRHYYANKEKYKEYQRNGRERRRKFIWDYLSSNPCVDCGETNPIVLEFDHVGKKKFTISNAIRDKVNLNRIKKEIAECEIRCSNCHKKKTAKTHNWYKNLSGMV